ncbi:hypothetical protein ANACOL_01002 [Anaerotruncus colihominis DSM 17241]|uniref:Uncharacterized protein n=1 Tax=Anaerotruncus colihominis DSM 17241 TaxID=445972 RepID=B0P8B3_9FIRM|nr:hypothetical protein ANACOL_01002 [Anaerotruncus colihominis DSM 17241]
MIGQKPVWRPALKSLWKKIIIFPQQVKEFVLQNIQICCKIFVMACNHSKFTQFHQFQRTIAAWNLCAASREEPAFSFGKTTELQVKRGLKCQTGFFRGSFIRCAIVSTV